MTNYHLKPLTTLPSLAAGDAKEKRRKELEAVRERRREIYKRFHKKMPLKADSVVDTMSSYGR